jgi:hypothetical protein
MRSFLASLLWDEGGQKGKRLEQQILAEKQKSGYDCPMTNPSLRKPKSRAAIPTVVAPGQKGVKNFCQRKLCVTR